MNCGAHARKDLCANAVLSGGAKFLWLRRYTSVSFCQGRDRVPRELRVHHERTYSVGSKIKRSQTDTSLLLVPNVSIAQTCCSSNISWVKEPADSTRFLSARHEVRRLHAKRCTTMSCDTTMTKELTEVVPFTMRSRCERSVPLWIGGARMLIVEAYARASRRYFAGRSSCGVGVGAEVFSRCCRRVQSVIASVESSWDAYLGWLTSGRTSLLGMFHHRRPLRILSSPNTGRTIGTVTRQPQQC